MNNPHAFTEHLLKDAGITQGMRVIDIGCGPGLVTALVAKLVGTTGHVLGLDREPKAIDLAKARAANSGLTNVDFKQVDLKDPLIELEPFDAVVGRRVLMYLPDPAAVLRNLCKALKPNGLLVFQETDSTMVPARLRPMPLHDQALSWIWSTIEREGGNVHMGFSLPATFRDSGIVLENLRMEPAIQNGSSHLPIASIVRAIIPRITKHGVATESEIDIETLEDRLAAELPADVVYVSDMAFGAWGRVAS